MECFLGWAKDDKPSLSLCNVGTLLDDVANVDIEADRASADETPVDTESDSRSDFSLDESTVVTLDVLIDEGSLVTEKCSEGTIAVGRTLMPDFEVLPKCPTGCLRTPDFLKGSWGADTSLTLFDIVECLDGDANAEIEPEAALAAPVGARCSNTVPVSEDGGTPNLSLAPMSSVVSNFSTVETVSACTLFSGIGVVVSDCALVPLRSDELLNGTNSAEPLPSLFSDADKPLDDGGTADIVSNPTSVDDTPVDAEWESPGSFFFNETSVGTLGVLIAEAFVTPKCPDGTVALGCAVLSVSVFAVIPGSTLLSRTGVVSKPSLQGLCAGILTRGLL